MISEEYLLVSSPDFPLIVNENGSVSLILNGFKPGTPINCTVSASNAAGTGPSTTSSATTDEERENLEIKYVHYVYYIYIKVHQMRIFHCHR